MDRHRDIDTAEPIQTGDDAGMFAANIIKRREIDPLLFKARNMIYAYEKAADCGVSIIDQSGKSVENTLRRNVFSFCGLCRQYCREPEEDPEEDLCPCGRIHEDGIAEARRRGGTFIYICELGFSFWLNPVYSGGRYALSLLAGGVLALKRGQVMEKICAFRGGLIPGETAGEYLANIPEKGHEEIKALARLLYICAGRLSAADHRPFLEYRSLKGLSGGAGAGFGGRSRRAKENSGNQETQDPVYPLDKERILFAALRRGDHETGRKILKELLEIVLVSNPGNFEFIRLRAIELVVLLSRAAVTPDASQDSAILDISSRCLKKIQESKNIEDLTGNLHLVIERLAGNIFSFKGIRHASALRKAERFIWENYTRKISLQETAGVSGLSAPYFSTIFKEEMGENFSAHLNRLRVEKAISIMKETSLPLVEIAETCGFEDQSWFSKIFKNYTGMSPGKYRGKGNDVN